MGHQTEIDKMATLFAEIHGLYLKCYKESSPHPIAAQNASNYIMQLLASCEAIIVRRDSRVVGTIIWQKFHNTLLNEDEIFIHEWFIHPLWRHKFVGKELYDEVVKVGKEQKCARLRGMTYNPKMIEVTKRQKHTSAVALMFEREL